MTFMSHPAIIRPPDKLEKNSMNPEDIKEVLEFPAFKTRDPLEVDLIRSILQETTLTKLQLDLLFNEESDTGGIICEAINESQEASLYARWLYKILMNIRERPDEDGCYPPVESIRQLVGNLANYDESMARDIQKLVLILCKFDKAKILDSQNNTVTLSSASGRLFSSPLTKDTPLVKDTVSMFNRNNIYQPAYESYILDNADQAISLHKIIKQVDAAGILNNKNILLIYQNIEELGKLSLAIDMFKKKGLFSKENAAVNFQSVIDNLKKPEAEFGAFISEATRAKNTVRR